MVKDQNGPEMPEKLLREMEQDAGKGISKDAEDHIWHGEDGSLDSEQWLDGDVEETGALSEILLAVIRSNPADEENEQKRLREAIKALTGESARGRPRENWQLLLAVGREYFHDFVNRGHPGFEDRSQNALVRAAVNKIGWGLPLDEEDFLKTVWKDFGKLKDKVLMEITARPSYQQDDRDFLTRRIINDLARLGYVKGAKSGI